ncbi:DoxX family protein [Roseomonas aerophila]|uniref:DoxX family protein n=1 Tax=Teichococcus aerophilus TaxID=1224513 RepID=A0ABR7RFM6_9PROT|nr:DoxX family protein [Pseudoroseomonas aerophila]MBC9205364.1 DoxX family protein [Pseudoroseomonas aerophila]
MMRRIGRWVLALAYLAAGILHLAMPEAFLRIVPGWVPYPHAVILATGACEILGAIGLMTRRLRRAAGIGLALYAVCVFPANIKHAVDDLSGLHAGLGWWYHGPRLALQPVLVWWALQAGVIFQGRSESARRRVRSPVKGQADGAWP